jgi:hypothetical protein
MQARVIHPITGATLYAYPVDRILYPLSLYATHRVLLVETNKLYEGTIDLDKSYNWIVFEGATTPTSYDDALYEELFTVGANIAGGITITPATISQINRGDQSEMYLLYNENKTVVIPTSSDFSTLSLKFVVENESKTNIYEVADGSISKTTTTITVPITPAVTGNTGQYSFSFRRTSNDEVIIYGAIYVNYAAY